MNIIYQETGSFNPDYAKSKLLDTLQTYSEVSGSIDKHLQVVTKFPDGWRLKLEINTRGTSSLSTEDPLTHNTHKVSVNLGSGSYNLVQVDNQGGHEDFHVHKEKEGWNNRQPYTISGNVQEAVSNIITYTLVEKEKFHPTL